VYTPFTSGCDTPTGTTMSTNPSPFTSAIATCVALLVA
jgi:hypothetical protein